MVQDSSATGEYAECLLKARFFEAARRPLALIETLKFDRGFARLDRHLARMAASAEVFGLAFDDVAALAGACEERGGRQGRAVAGTADLERSGRSSRQPAETLPPNPPHWTYVLSSKHVDSDDVLLRHKTNWREFYDREAARHHTDEVIFLNERGELTEGTRSNIFVRRDGKLLTPPLSSGVLDGRLRAELIANGQCTEAVLTEVDLEGEVFGSNT